MLLTDVPFVPFEKIPRWSNQYIVITEKIDGTNASIFINEACDDLLAASRSGWITPDKDNYGFAKWVEANREALLKLGKGHHFGEWWGFRIQRSYNMKEPVFSLFNTMRWSTPEQKERLDASPCRLVPILYEGPFSETAIDDCMKRLETEGSVASPGFQNPEGIVIYSHMMKQMFKKTIGFDGHKGEVNDTH